MITSEQLSKQTRLLRPIQSLNLTVAQRFGENLLPLYKNIGLLGHNGLDLYCPTGTPIRACFSGIVSVASIANVGYGVEVRLESDEFEIEGQKMKLEAIYGHNLRFLVQEGQRVNEGQIISYSDNTGYSTGPHLHFEIRVKYEESGFYFRDYNNGYFGAIDPEPLLTSSPPNTDFLIKDVSQKYGFKQNTWLERKIRFFTPSIHIALSKVKRAPLSLTNDEVNALAYGGWSIQEVLNDTDFPKRSRMTRTTFQAREFEFFKNQRNKL